MRDEFSGRVSECLRGRGINRLTGDYSVNHDSDSQSAGKVMIDDESGNGLLLHRTSTTS